MMQAGEAYLVALAAVMRVWGDMMMVVMRVMARVEARRLLRMGCRTTLLGERQTLKADQGERQLMRVCAGETESPMPLRAGQTRD
jgi:hypothetical protein